MEIDIAVIGDEDTVLGFQLAGVKHGALFSEESIKESLSTFADAKILILTEQVAEYLRQQQLMGNGDECYRRNP
jgi:vacuolar-type H+-ATPase subunit F/Vma7